MTNNYYLYHYIFIDVMMVEFVGDSNACEGLEVLCLAGDLGILSSAALDSRVSTMEPC